MIRRNLLFLIAALMPISGTGCIVVGTGSWGWRAPYVWTEITAERIPIDTANLQALEARTHNGSIAFDGQPPGVTDAHVTVKMKASGLTRRAAEATLEAVQVFVEPAGGGTQRIGWKWKGIKRPRWRAHVSFEIHAPGNLRFDGETHNGPLYVAGVTGDVHVVTHNGPARVMSSSGNLYVRTHNGPIEVKDAVGDVHVITHNGPLNVGSGEGRLHAETHNGQIVAAYTGDDVTLATHNGPIVADFSQCAALDGTITTHNGGVNVIVGENTSSDLDCRTHNGSIRCDAPLNDRNKTRRWLTGTLGDGDGNLNVATHNGSVRIKTSTG